jgi:hypothetical protein
MANPPIFGHGLIDPGVEIWVNRRSAARQMLNSPDEGIDPHAGTILRKAALLWRDVMTAVMQQNSADWLPTSAMLGHPTPQECRRTVTDLGILSEAAALDDPFAVWHSLDIVRRSQFPLRLVRLLDSTEPGIETPYEVASNWARGVRQPVAGRLDRCRYRRPRPGRRAERSLHLRVNGHDHHGTEILMIDPPANEPDTPERKVELDQTVDYAIQLLVEEAHLVGWTRVEFLTAVLDAANARLSAIEEERDLEEGQT